jgi:NAD(P)-dependent dehydrogenase (short-subunit alcohol dehydrogenase family)
MWISSTSLDGKIALVTGAGRGLGRAIALNLAQASAQVALPARSGDELDQTAKQVRESRNSPSSRCSPASTPRTPGTSGTFPTPLSTDDQTFETWR